LLLQALIGPVARRIVVREGLVEDLYERYLVRQLGLWAANLVDREAYLRSPALALPEYRNRDLRDENGFPLSQTTPRAAPQMEDRPSEEFGAHGRPPSLGELQ
jgi:hypothetical protein